MVSLQKNCISDQVLVILGGPHSQGVVSICSPVKTAFAPAMKHIACSDSLKVFLPAARRMIVLGMAMRAVAIVRTSDVHGNGLLSIVSEAPKSQPTEFTSFPSRGVPGIGTRALTGNDSGCSGMLHHIIR